MIRREAIRRGGGFIPSLMAATALMLIMTSCGDEAVPDDPSQSPPAEALGEAADGDSSGSEEAQAKEYPAETDAPVQGFPSAHADDIVVLDIGQMPEFDCHVMGGVIMGDCSQADLEAQILAMGMLTVDTERMADFDCHVMDKVIMGACTPEDISRLINERVIIVDRQSMADEACHVMGNTIMGACSDDDISRLAEEIRSAR
jgi:hypothetical protein